MKIRYIQPIGKPYPPFYYGFFSYNIKYDGYVYYIWPLNVLIKLWRVFRYVRGSDKRRDAFRYLRIDKREFMAEKSRNQQLSKDN